MNDNNIDLEKWKHIINTQMHFNEMLMRLRTLGLSMVITIMGAGLIFIISNGNGLDYFKIHIITFLIIFLIIIALCGYLLGRGIRNESFQESSSKTEINALKFLLYIPIFVFVYFVYVYISLGDIFINIPIGILITSGGFLLLISLYLLDRFYYYELLVGSVKMGQNIENESNCSNLSKELSSRVTLREASKVVTIYYALPALGGMAIIFGWIIKIN